MTRLRSLLAAGLVTGLVTGLAALSLAPTASAASLSPAATEALQRALADEYHAEAFYDAVMTKFGAVRPFSNIIRSEQKHAAMLADLMNTYGIAVPANAALGSPDVAKAVPATLGEACKAGIAAEIANRDLYLKDLLPAVADQPDIVAVFERLQAASNNNHLPAFERCARRN